MSRPSLYCLYEAGFVVGGAANGDIALRFPLYTAWESFLTHRAPAKGDFGQAVIPAAGWKLLLDCIDETILEIRDPFVGDLFTAVRRRYARADAATRKRIIARCQYLIREMEHEP